MNAKITTEHLRRGAIVYVRQSTIGQVIEHTESQRRQYGLAESAKAMGFATVTTIDQDLGRSGSGLVERRGFQHAAPGAAADLAATDGPVLAALAAVDERRIEVVVTIVADHLYLK